MPYKMSKLKSGKYKVENAKTGRIHAKGTTKTKAERQIRLLRMIESKKK